jgi:hypothetical protein
MEYKCEKCKMTFETEREFEIHLKLYHHLWAGEEWIYTRFNTNKNSFLQRSKVIFLKRILKLVQLGSEGLNPFLVLVDVVPEQLVDVLDERVFRRFVVV